VRQAGRSAGLRPSCELINRTCYKPGELLFPGGKRPFNFCRGMSQKGGEGMVRFREEMR